MIIFYFLSQLLTLKGWARRVRSSKGGGGRTGGARNFALFVLSRRKFLSFFPLLGVLSWNFGGVSSAADLKCVRLEFSGCRVKPPSGLAKVELAKVEQNTKNFVGAGPSRIG